MKSLKFLTLALFLNAAAVPLVFAQSYNHGYNYNEEGIRIGEYQFQDVPSKQIGPATIQASLNEQEQYDSNVFWTPNSARQSDQINVTSPAVLLTLPVGVDERNVVQALYNADIGTFSKFSSQDYVNQHAAGNADFKLPFGYFNLQDDFIHTVDRASTEFTTEVPRNENKASTIVGVDLNQFALETGFTDDVHTYTQSSFEIPFAYDERTVSETAYYQLAPKTKALVEYDHDFINYYKTSTRDGFSDQVLVGVKGDVTGKTQALIKVGYQNRNYDTLGQQGFSNFVATAGTITQLSERTRLALTFVDTAVESTYSNNNYYNMIYFDATLNQKIVGHLSVDLNSDVSDNLYPEVDPTLFQQRHDTIVDEGIALKYDIKDWVDAKIGYTLREQMTNISGLQYTDNLWSVGLDLKY